MYQVVRDGKWTKDKAAEFCKTAGADLNGDSEMNLDDDRFGYVTNHAHEHMNAFNRSMSSIENGKPVLCLMNENVAEVFDWVRKFYYETDGRRADKQERGQPRGSAEDVHRRQVAAVFGFSRAS